jgi:hypothetical protein
MDAIGIALISSSAVGENRSQLAPTLCFQRIEIGGEDGYTIFNVTAATVEIFMALKT